MIIDKINNAKDYYSIFPALERINEVVTDIKNGKYDCSKKIEIDGDNLFCSVSTYMTKPHEGAEYESHKKYADVQVVLKGCEVIGWAPLSECVITKPFQDGGDIAFYNSDAGSPVLLTEDSFMVMMPQDAHMPCLLNSNSSEVTKAVFKVKLSEK